MTKDKATKTKHLGRGLASLLGPINTAQSARKVPIPIDEVGHKPLQTKDLDTPVQQISLDDIAPNPYQVRTTWDDQALADLAHSISANGVVQPIIVRRQAGAFQIIAGERRFRAAKLAKLDAIPAIIRRATDEQMLELALVENIHRTNLNAIERAKAYQSYLSRFSLTQAQVAQRLGEDRSVIANHLRLLDLPDEIKQMLIDRRLSMGHARAILALPTDELRRKLANRALAGRLSVREVERLVRRYTTGPRPAPSIRTKPPHIIDLETQLSRELGTKVNIETRKNRQRGRIVIEFYSLDEFDRITERLGLTTAEQT